MILPGKMGGTHPAAMAGGHFIRGSSLTLIYHKTSAKNFVYYSMRIYVIKSGKEYETSIPIADPDTDQVMYMLEKLVGIMELPEDEVEEYVIGWAEEIQNKRLI
jgi:hypothetical protein